MNVVMKCKKNKKYNGRNKTRPDDRKLIINVNQLSLTNCKNGKCTTIRGRVLSAHDVVYSEWLKHGLEA